MISMANGIELKAYPEEMSLEPGSEMKTFTEFPQTKNTVELNVGRSSPITPTDVVSEVSHTNENTSDNCTTEADQPAPVVESEIADEPIDFVEVNADELPDPLVNDHAHEDTQMIDAEQLPTTTTDNSLPAEAENPDTAAEPEETLAVSTEKDLENKPSADVATEETPAPPSEMDFESKPSTEVISEEASAFPIDTDLENKSSTDDIPKETPACPTEVDFDSKPSTEVIPEEVSAPPTEMDLESKPLPDVVAEEIPAFSTETNVENKPSTDVIHDESTLEAHNSTEPASNVESSLAEMDIEAAPAATNGHEKAPVTEVVDIAPKEEKIATTSAVDEGRPSKRPNYDEPAVKRSHKMSRLSEIEHAKALVGTFASTAVSPPRRPNITREQLKYCSAILKALKRHRDAGPFLKPVDHVKMQIPDYPKIVKTPMDFSTIEKKLNNNQYITVDDFVADVRQVFENCYLYNGRESIVSTFAQNLEKVFNNQLRKMPQATPKIVESTKDESFNESRPRSRPRSNSRRSSTGSKDRRESQSSITSTKRGSLKNPLPDVHYKFCMSVIKEFFKKTHSHYAYPFLEPVDWKSLDIPDYLTIIKHPMDASTIKRNLESGLYSTPEEFEADVRLMFRNCYKYNPPKTPVYTMGQTLENIFNAKWAQKPSLPPPKEPTPEPEPEEFSEQEESSDEEDDKHAQQIAELERHLEFMSKQLASMKGAAREKKKKEKVKTPVKAKTQASKAPKGTKASKSAKTKSTPKPRSRKASAPEYSTDDEKYPEITFEQKRELSDSINLLPGEKLNTVVSIIHSSMPHLKDTSGQEEIELDIDSLDHRTLYKLYKFVRTNVAPKRAKPARKNSRPHFSEEEQTRKIHELEENLRKFESAESHSSVKADRVEDDNSGSSSSSSGSSSSGSDSDSGSESN
ncbi:hypothetical protein K493DRAFT_332536 [Basidiobolus meristosporus CBS 931.73]|uniref:Bromodomain-containing protein n=1 Tax=Basidiobolus meristosporus CBS 931.73 TaxID=1314790 RepID=A0A1Y1ZCQ6_9FUNG|nr:hypothetical protein K493DRAFT_332536 [Basidiobolus meristosporus CBS 931.73]|eukprot:ORY07996.1 hypothetical protein K493DRAFT_332536 [Basidiobolus meristosporus CBS 931.73]